MRFTVGGQDHDLTAKLVAERLKHIEPEPIREHIVEISGTDYPPKQVFAVATGRARQSFTTMEAQRVLTRLGFRCHRLGLAPKAPPADGHRGTRPASVQAQLDTLMVAVAGLSQRVSELEAKR